MNNAAPSPLSPSAPSPSSPCPCGSNRKYKKCCQPLTGAEKHYRDEEKRELVRRAEGTALEVLMLNAIRIAGEEFLETATDLYCCGEFEDVVLPDLVQSPAEELEWTYCQHLYIVFGAPFDVADEQRASFAQYLLERHPTRLRADQAQFVKAVIPERYRWLSITDTSAAPYITVTDIESGERFVVRDLVLSEYAVAGMLLLSMVFKMWGDYYLLGAFPRPLPGDLAGKMIEMKQRAVQAVADAPEVVEVKDSLNRPINQALQDRMSQDFIVRSLFYSVVSAYLEPSAEPRIHNTDGDPMEPREIIYDLKMEPALAREKLLEGSKQFKLMNDDIVWFGAKPKRDPFGEYYMRGKVQVDPDKLHLGVNSKKRAQKLRKLVERILGEGVSFISEHEIDPNAAIDDSDQDGQIINDEMLEAHPEIAKAIQAKMDTYYETWIDQEIPALGGMTPRQAAKDKKMKHALEALLLEFERRSDTAKQRQVITPDVSIIRARLFGDAGH